MVEDRVRDGVRIATVRVQPERALLAFEAGLEAALDAAATKAA